MPAVQACVPAALERDVKLAGVAAFTVDPAGRPSGLVVRVPAAALYVEEASWSGCARDVVASWSLPLAPSGGRFWLTFPGLGPAHAGGPAPGSPAYATGGYTKPVLRDPSCVQDSLQLPYRHSGFSAANVTVLFAVGPDGEPGWFRVVSSGVPAGVAEAIWKAMRACEWEPGRDPQGNPAAVYVVLPLSFSTRRGE
jgi:hypothetical protein